MAGPLLAAAGLGELEIRVFGGRYGLRRINNSLARSACGSRTPAMTTPAERVQQLVAQYDRDDLRVAQLLCDDYAAEAVAFTLVDSNLDRHELTYGELRERSERFAGALAELGIGRGDRVATLMGKSADYLAVLLGTWRTGAVHVPLFTAFGPGAIATRLIGSEAKVVVADGNQRPKLDPSTEIPANAEWRVVTKGDVHETRSGDLALEDLMSRPPTDAPPVAFGAHEPFIMLFTSGTTGAPKGVPVPVRAMAAFRIYLEYGLDVRAEDVYWNAADPGWAYGLYYAVVAPLAAGRSSVLLQAGFSCELTWQVLSDMRVTNFAAAPTVYRSLRAHPRPIPKLVLRCASSAGEPLNSDVVTWAERALSIPVRDHYGQTEIGMAIANCWHPDVQRAIRPGSMGHALPGWTAAVLNDDSETMTPPNTVGRVAIDVPASPLMWFTGYHAATDRTAQRFSSDGRWYFTADAGSFEPKMEPSCSRRATTMSSSWRATALVRSMSRMSLLLIRVCRKRPLSPCQTTFAEK